MPADDGIATRNSCQRRSRANWSCSIPDPSTCSTITSRAWGDHEALRCDQSVRGIARIFVQQRDGGHQLANQAEGRVGVQLQPALMRDPQHIGQPRALDVVGDDRQPPPPVDGPRAGRARSRRAGSSSAAPCARAARTRTTGRRSTPAAAAAPAAVRRWWHQRPAHVRRDHRRRAECPRDREERWPASYRGEPCLALCNPQTNNQARAHANSAPMTRLLSPFRPCSRNRRVYRAGGSNADL